MQDSSSPEASFPSPSAGASAGASAEIWWHLAAIHYLGFAETQRSCRVLTALLQNCFEPLHVLTVALAPY